MQSSFRAREDKWIHHTQKAINYQLTNIPRMTIKICWEEVKSPWQNIFMVIYNKMGFLQIISITIAVLNIENEYNSLRPRPHHWVFKLTDHRVLTGLLMLHKWENHARSEDTESLFHGLLECVNLERAILRQTPYISQKSIS